MRTLDRPLPSIGGPRPGLGSPRTTGRSTCTSGSNGFPLSPPLGRLHDHLGRPRRPFTWDDETTWPFDRIDATCDTEGFEVDRERPEPPDGQPQSAELNLTLANGDGQWSQYDSFGRLIDYGPGGHIDLWITEKANGEPWWVYSGTIDAWRETAEGTVQIQAFDDLSRLNQQIGEWNPGTYGEKAPQRLNAILDLINDVGIRRFDVGEVTLHSFTSTATPLEEAHAVARSDGGQFGIDTDGTRLYRNRAWPGGRADQDEIRVFSDNVCTVPHIVWDPELASTDDDITNIVELENVAELTAGARDQASINRHGPNILSRRNDQWIDPTDGTVLARHIITQTADAYLRIDSFTLHLIDWGQDLWRTGIDLRPGDLLRYLRDQPAVGGPARVDINAIAAGIRHEVTPQTWVVTVACTPAVGNNVTWQWDAGGWLVWDADPPDPVWGF